MPTTISQYFVHWLLLVSCAAVVAADPPPPQWGADYRAGVAQAKEAKSMLLVFFHDENQADANREWLRRLASDATVRERLAKHTLVSVPCSYRLAEDDASTLLRHAAFTDMLGQPGFAVLDFSDPASRHYQYVVSVLPFTVQSAPALSQVAELLNLPTGSLTQRSLIFAVRTHSDRPQSAASETLAVLIEEAEQHSVHQARINLQGHHQWDSRFHRINAKLPGGLVAKEVCAESWPGQTLLDAAKECVHSWRQSPGHWNAVNQRHAFYGYDMKRGSNGVWYGTGIFATR